MPKGVGKEELTRKSSRCVLTMSWDASTQKSQHVTYITLPYQPIRTMQHGHASENAHLWHGWPCSRYQRQVGRATKVKSPDPQQMFDDLDRRARLRWEGASSSTWDLYDTAEKLVNEGPWEVHTDDQGGCSCTSCVRHDYLQMGMKPRSLYTPSKAKQYAQLLDSCLQARYGMEGMKMVDFTMTMGFSFTTCTQIPDPSACLRTTGWTKTKMPLSHRLAPKDFVQRFRDSATITRDSTVSPTYKMTSQNNAHFDFITEIKFEEDKKSILFDAGLKSKLSMWNPT